MTHYEFHRILGSINTLSPDQMRLLRNELDGKLAASGIAPDDDARAEAGERNSAPAVKTILEMVDELRAQVPPEEFSKLPKDGARRLDHYIRGAPKRPIA